MENGLAGLSLDEEEDAVLQIQAKQVEERREETFRLVGCFLTASVINFSTMKNTMANLWNPVRGVNIRDLGEKRYLFQFYHRMDLERVLKGCPWTFNNHLLVLHVIQWGEDPLRIPLIKASFWIQIHDIPTGFYSENLAIQLGNFLGEFMEYDGSSLGKENRNYMRIRVKIDVRRPLKKRKQILCYGRLSYVKFRYERLSLFCFFCGRLGHNDLFCDAKMLLGMEVAEMGWDLSLRAQSRRAVTTSSVWLREEEIGQTRGNTEDKTIIEDDARVGNSQMAKHGKFIDPVLGFNLEGRKAWEKQLEIGEGGEKASAGWRGRMLEVRRLRYMLRLQNPQMVFFMEMKICRSRMERIRHRCRYVNGIEVDPEGTRRGLCLAWKQGVNVTLHQFSKRHINVVIDDDEVKGKWRFTGFYRSPYERDKNNSWEELRSLYTGERFSWFVCGDFNEIMYGFEKKGRVPRDERRMELNLEIDKDERYWEQRTRINWLRYGDKNTAFFHSQASSRRRKNMIQKMQSDNGQVTENIQDIKNIARAYFRNLFGTEERECCNYLLSKIKRCITEEDNQFLMAPYTKEDNQFLMAPYTKEEIREATFGMGPTKASGEDGFLVIFYQQCWHIVKDEVNSFCLQVLNKGRDFKQVNSTHIVLIPKIANLTNMKQFRPISLCNVIYKIMAKAIANRLRGVIKKCIDAAQSAFVPGRLITDNILLAYEILHTLKQKRMGRKGFMAVKLDMSKAYDRVEWNFVKEIMIRMGFANGWIETILECIIFISYSVVINGFKGENFWPSRDLRQGDPLSPFLFLMCGEGLSSLMRLAMSEGSLKGVKASRSGPKISHLLFADDCILFSDASSRGAIVLKEILKKYRSSSEQSVNFDKSTVFFSTNTLEIERNLVINILGVRSSNNPKRYLGLPNMVGRKKKESFQILKDKMKQRIDHWSTRHLSQGRKEIFIKSILQAIPTYMMACIHWCEWRKLYDLKENGSLGFRNMCQFNTALLAKQGWRLIVYPDSLLARVLKAKYFPNSDFLNAQLGNLPSLTWRSIWAAKGLLRSGMGWRVGRGTEISVWDDHWIPGKEINGWEHQTENEVKLVADLIDAENNEWKTELVERPFTADIAEKVLQIPLAKNLGADIQIWRGELSGDFLVRSAYKILQNARMDPNDLLLQTDTKKFYKKLWNLKLPSKLLITVWRASWNYLPTLVNLRSKRIATSMVCPRCGSGEEDIGHVFRFCPATKEIWHLLKL
ncbi:reverse transcriptase [Gossypium australe]|uniref:Reverse transcriptase n=1 Tax=Gossypium australe TaxID=47621 RepID=A0A5B6USR0_9ROSI|nr:reverse transcriptase [Gossypium australe]